MWLLNFLPDFFIHLIFLAGLLGTIAGFVLGFIPLISRYKLPIQIVSIVLLSAGLWLEGGLANEARYKAEHERLKAEIEQKEAKAKELNANLSKISAERDAAIAEKGQTITKTIDRYIQGDPVEIVKEIDLSDEERAKLQSQIEELQKAEKECRIPSILIDQLNDAAKRPVGLDYE